jgi:homoserine kinase type II
LNGIRRLDSHPISLFSSFPSFSGSHINMGTFRSLSPDDVQEVLRGYGLAGYRGHRVVAAGTINTNLAVEVDGGPLFLRVNEGKALADVVREVAIVDYVAGRGLPTPRPLRTPAGEAWLEWRGLYVSLFPWVTGRVLGRAEVQPLTAHQAGAALARLHQAGADFPDRRPGRYEAAEIARRFATIRDSAAGDPELVAAAAELGPVLARLETTRAAELPAGLIHGDLFIDNVLFHEGSLTALLDFEQASWGRLAYDLAVSVLAFGFGADDFRPDITRAFLGGYTGMRPLAARERQAFADELRFAACRFAVTRITDVYLRRNAGAPPGKDFRRYLLRLRALERQLREGTLFDLP